MAIVPINGISVRQNHRSMINFGSKKSDSGEAVPQRTNSAMSVPVVVLMALSPSLLNAGGITNSAPLDAKALTEMAAESRVPEAEGATYIMDMAAPASVNNLTPGQRNYLRAQGDDVIYKKDAGNGAILVFEKLTKPNEVRFIKYLPGNSQYSGKKTETPSVTMLVYHDIGKDKEYCGVMTRVWVRDDDHPKGGYYLDKEYRIPDETANDLIALVTSGSEFVNKAGFKWMNTTDADLLPTKKVEPRDYEF